MKITINDLVDDFIKKCPYYEILVDYSRFNEEVHSGKNLIGIHLMALMEKPQADVTEADLQELIERTPLEPNIEVLN